MIQAAMDAENQRGDGGAPCAGDGDQSAEKKTRLSAPDEGHAPSLSDMFSEILQESASKNNNSMQCANFTFLFLYLSEVPITRSDNPLAYWRSNHGRVTIAHTKTKGKDGTPCTSTDSERLLSAAAHVLDEKRNRLHCDKAEKLLFIKRNLPLYLKK
ncbi:hypothetical protein PO909_029920 [Leuciscus waleckii]